jgi:hypothetical protein
MANRKYSSRLSIARCYGGLSADNGHIIVKFFQFYPKETPSAQVGKVPENLSVDGVIHWVMALPVRVLHLACSPGSPHTEVVLVTPEGQDVGECGSGRDPCVR